VIIFLANLGRQPAGLGAVILFALALENSGHCTSNIYCFRITPLYYVFVYYQRTAVLVILFSACVRDLGN